MRDISAVTAFGCLQTFWYKKIILQLYFFGEKKMTFKQITNELKLSLIQLLPDRINKMILYGFYARKEASSDSNIDMLVICNGLVDSQLREQIYNECYKINAKYDVWIDVSLLAESDLTTIRDKQPYIQNALYEGKII